MGLSDNLSGHLSDNLSDVSAFDLGISANSDCRKDTDSLIAKVKSYNSSADLALLLKAASYAHTKHGGQSRASGEPYYTHPLAVAHILADRRLDMDSLVTGLLHDVVEDSEVLISEIENEFSPTVASLVDGVTKLTKLEMDSLANNRQPSKAGEQVANYRKLFFATNKDIRVLLVKLADRLHNMRTLHHIKNAEKCRRIAQETLLIYAPLAERMGLYLWKDELQDLAFKRLNPKAYKEIKEHLKEIKGEPENLRSISKEISNILAENGIKAKVVSRLKSPASIWQKSEKRGIRMQNLADIMAFRVIVDDVEQCYRTLGVLHANFPAFFSGFRDYISSPKPNGYQSLHTSLSGPQKQVIEIQIRTTEMHENSENGIASHWRYKSGVSKKGKRGMEEPAGQLAWLRDTIERLEEQYEGEDPQLTLKNFSQLEMYQDQVFCFTPKHDLIALRHGAVVLDFAYAVHTEVGHHCEGAIVNGKRETLSYVLQNGDRVEILTSDSQHPDQSWKDIAATSRTRSILNRYFKYRARRQKINLVEISIEREFKQFNVKYNKGILKKALTKLAMDKRYKGLNLLDTDDLLYAVAQDQIPLEELFIAAYPLIASKLLYTGNKFFSDSVLTVNFPSSHFAVSFGRCCHPVPGDEIVGIKTIGLGLTVHRIDCRALENLEGMRERWKKVSWNEAYFGNRQYVGHLEVTVKNNPGALGHVCTLIGEHSTNIADLKFSKRVSDYYVMNFDLEVSDLHQLQLVIQALENLSDVHAVLRS